MVTYIIALMQVERPEDNEEKFWFPTPEHPGNEQEHSPIQKRILKGLRDLAELEKLYLNRKRTIPKQISFDVQMDRFTDYQ